MKSKTNTTVKENLVTEANLLVECGEHGWIPNEHGGDQNTVDTKNSNSGLSKKTWRNGKISTRKYVNGKSKYVGNKLKYEAVEGRYLNETISRYGDGKRQNTNMERERVYKDQFG